MCASSVSNFVSGYGSIAPYSGLSRQFFYELDQSRIGATLWQRPDLYIENSPIFRANKIQTPLLMMNNMEDGIVPFAQGIELFTALRRLNKKVWLLQYDGETHSISDPKAKKDYTIRMDQFFDHYLKGAPAPIWMTKGISVSKKGITDGLHFDSDIDSSNSQK
jgi:dipeptidyl aminopeptidase/acylaminoacyl peptidase